MTIDEEIKELKDGNYLTNSEELQIAEWLEELKTYRECNVCEYNKAIDDAKNVILQTLDNEILVDTLHLRLEQLKAGGENETVL